MTVLLIALSGALFFMQTNVDAKKLTGIQVELLNCSLAPMPEVTYRLKVSKDQASKISHLLSDDAKFKSCEARVNELPDKSGNVSLKPDGKKFLMNMVKQMLMPVKDFFSEIQSHKGMVQPLIEESLKEHPSLDISTTAGNTMATNSLLIGFLTASTSDIIAYYEEKITSVFELKKMSLELTYFLNDLDESFSPQVLEAYEVLKKKLEASHASESATQSVAGA